MMDFLPRTRIFVDDVRDPDDIEPLVEIHAAGFRRGWTVDEFERLLADETVFGLVLRRESLFGLRRVLGFILVRIVADEAEVLTIAIAAGRRGRGHGRLLMEAALRRLYSERVPTVFLEVDEGNGPAAALYHKLGFREVGRRKGYYADGRGGASAALVMRLQLR